MAVLDLQRRSQQIGRIRLGQQVKTGSKDKAGNDKTRPAKLDTFRFTTASRDVADAIAGLFGGEVRVWENRGRREWEVITGVSEIGVTVPPRDAVVSQWYEMWTAGGCQRRCDSQTEQRSGKPCMCPHAADPTDAAEVERAALERAGLAKMNPPKACSLVTRISVMIPDLPGLGVFRLDTGSFYAAGEIIDQATLMEMARDAGVFLPAKLRIEQRMTISDGQTKKYPVPVLDVLTTARAIITGELAAGGMAAQLPPAPGERRAITSGSSAAPVPNVQRNAARPAAATPPAQPATAQEVADLAATARSRARLRPLIRLAQQKRWEADLVCTDKATDEWQELSERLRSLWAALPDDRPPAQAAAPPAPGKAAESQGSAFDAGEWPGGAA